MHRFSIPSGISKFSTSTFAVAMVTSIGFLACADSVILAENPDDASPQQQATEDGGGFSDVNESDARVSDYQCSEDLHSVLDYQGEVVRSCPEDQGCKIVEGSSLEGEQLELLCVPACESAALNHSGKGCEHYVVPPLPFDHPKGMCFAVTVANRWTTDVSIAVDYGETALESSTFVWMAPANATPPITYTPLPNGKLPPGEIAIVMLANLGNINIPGTTCPAAAAIVDRYIENENIAVINSFRITTDRPVTAYAFYPCGGGTAFTGVAALLFPTHIWTNNYIAQTPFMRSGLVGGEYSRRFVQVAPKEDDTRVTIQPTVDLIGNDTVSSKRCRTPY